MGMLPLYLKNGGIFPVSGNECQGGNDKGIRWREILVTDSLYGDSLFFTMTHQDLVESSLRLVPHAFLK